MRIEDSGRKKGTGWVPPSGYRYIYRYHTLANPEEELTYVRYVRYAISMPDVKVYIRKENIQKWNDIANKSEWINTLLKNSDDTSSYGRTIDTPVGPAVTVLSEMLPPLSVKEQLEELGLLYDPTLPGQAYSQEEERYIKYTVKDGEVILK